MHPLVYAFAVSLLALPSAERVRALQEATLLADGFRSVAGVQRLPSEALLVSDPEAGVVVRIRGDGSRSTIRFDQGSTPGGIYPLSDRSWAVVDRSGERYFEIDPSGSRQTSERMLPATPGVLRVGSSDDPIQVDGEGRILRGGGLSRGGRPMVLEVFKGSQSRPLAQLAADPFATVGAGGIRATVKVPFQTGDRWAVGVDGRVGIVRVDPHRVDWWTDDGGLREGEPISWSPIRVTEEDRTRFLAETQLPTLGGLTLGDPADLYADIFPKTKGPLRGAPRMDPYGRLWVPRPTGSDGLYTVEVFSPNGAPGQVKLAEGDELVGFDGPDAVILARKSMQGVSVWTLPVAVSVPPEPILIGRHDVADSLFQTGIPEPLLHHTVAIATDDGSILGSGVILDAGWVITAAHVVAEHHSSRLQVRILGEEAGVDSIVVHPRWPGNGGRELADSGWDLALLKVGGGVKSRDSESISLGPPPEIGSLIHLAGFGRGGAHGRNPPGTLRAGTNRLDSLSFVVPEAPHPLLVWDFDGPDAEGDVTEREVLFVGGDSGCGVFVESEDGRFTLFGIAVRSGFQFAGSIREPLFYGSTSVAVALEYHRDWLDLVLGQTMEQ